MNPFWADIPVFRAYKIVILAYVEWMDLSFWTVTTGNHSSYVSKQLLVWFQAPTKHAPYTIIRSLRVCLHRFNMILIGGNITHEVTDYWDLVTGFLKLEKLLYGIVDGDFVWNKLLKDWSGIQHEHTAVIEISFLTDKIMSLSSLLVNIASSECFWASLIDLAGCPSRTTWKMQ